jgi:two-component system, chemotaxis family, chemotaxis protein CheY
MSPGALVVDDSRAKRSILAKILVRLGFKALKAADGLEGIATLDSASPPVELVLSDRNMPEMDGLKFVKTLRANTKFANVVVVMVTNETHMEQMLTALSANEYIMKPFTAEMFEEKLRMLQVVG